MEKDRTTNEWDIFRVKEYLKNNPEKVEYIKELIQMKSEKRVEVYLSLVKQTTNSETISEFVGFSVFTLGLREVQLKELLQ